MATLAQSLDKVLVVSLVIAFLSCSQPITTQNKYFDLSKVQVSSSKGVASINGAAITGIVYALYENGDTQLIQSYKDGKKHGTWKKMYNNRNIAEIREYKEGLKEGEYKGYWPSGSPKFTYHFKLDLYHGNNKGWMPDGTLIQDMNYSEGKELGKQTIWYRNGQIKSNYVVKNGRRYGLYGTKNCKNTAEPDTIK